MRDLATALALVFVIEGVLCSLFPDWMKRVVARAVETPSQSLRFTGLAAVCVGVALVWAIRYLA